MFSSVDGRVYQAGQSDRSLRFQNCLNPLSFHKNWQRNLFSAHTTPTVYMKRGIVALYIAVTLVRLRVRKHKQATTLSRTGYKVTWLKFWAYKWEVSQNPVENSDEKNILNTLFKLYTSLVCCVVKIVLRSCASKSYWASNVSIQKLSPFSSLFSKIIR